LVSFCSVIQLLRLARLRLLIHPLQDFPLFDLCSIAEICGETAASNKDRFDVASWIALVT
jgi:hypothetical protein